MTLRSWEVVLLVTVVLSLLFLGMARLLVPYILSRFPVWLFYIGPALVVIWLLYRLVYALRLPSPHRQVEPPKRRPANTDIDEPVKKQVQRPRGADITHGRPTKPR